MSWFKTAGPWLVIAVAVVFAYLPARENQYAYDDVAIVQFNPVLAPTANLLDSLKTPYWNAATAKDQGLYRPLTIASFKLTRMLGWQVPKADHLVNVGLHLLVTLLLFVFLQRMSANRWLSLVLAILYGTHPVHTEVVAGLVGRGDLLATLFFLLAALVVTPLPIVDCKRLLCMGFLVFLSLSAKESTVMSFLLLPVLSWLVTPHPAPTDRRKLFAIALAAIAGGVSYYVLKILIIGRVGVSSTGSVFFAMGWLRARLAALAFDSFFLEKIFKPLPLLPDYATGVIVLGSGVYWLRIAVTLVLLLSVVIWYWRRVLRMGRVKSPALWLMLFAIAIFPVSNALIDIGTIFGERLLYFPMIFIVLFGAQVVNWQSFAKPSRVGLSILAVSLVIIFVFLDRRRAPDWHDNFTLTQAGVRDAPNNYQLRIGLGMELMTKGQPDLATQQFEAAIPLFAYPVAAHLKLGELAIARQDYAGGVYHNEAVLSMPVAKPTVELYYNTFVAYCLLRSDTQALRYLLRAVNLARSQPDKLAEIQRTLAATSRQSDLHVNWIERLILNGRKADAIEALKASMVLLPNSQVFQAQLRRLAGK